MIAFKCLSCSAVEATQVFFACKDYYLRKSYLANYVRCTNCGLLQQSPLPPDPGSFYDAYPVHQGKSRFHAIMRSLVMAPVYFRDRDVPAGATVIDIGCGDGWFLARLKKRGIQCVGFEMNSAHAQTLANQLEVPIFSQKDHLLALWSEKADMVTMHFVLEHVSDLHDVLQTVKKLLKPGGIFYFVVPNIASLEAKIFKKMWHNLDPPRHISFPEEAHVKQLAAQHGFLWQRRKWVPFPNGFAGSVPVVLTGQFRFSLFLLALPFGILFSRLFPNGAGAYWIKKPAEHRDT